MESTLWALWVLVMILLLILLLALRLLQVLHLLVLPSFFVSRVFDSLTFPSPNRIR